MTKCSCPSEYDGCHTLEDCSDDLIDPDIDITICPTCGGIGCADCIDEDGGADR